VAGADATHFLAHVGPVSATAMSWHAIAQH